MRLDKWVSMWQMWFCVVSIGPGKGLRPFTRSLGTSGEWPEADSGLVQTMESLEQKCPALEVAIQWWNAPGSFSQL